MNSKHFSFGSQSVKFHGIWRVGERDETQKNEKQKSSKSKEKKKTNEVIVKREKDIMRKVTEHRRRAKCSKTGEGE